MPRLRAIILEQTGGGPYHYALWVDVPVARQPFYAKAGAVSAWTGALAGDITAIQTGAVAERLDTIERLPGETRAQMQTRIETRWQAWQDEVTNENFWRFHGTTWDGAMWTPGLVS